MTLGLQLGVSGKENRIVQGGLEKNKTKQKTIKFNLKHDLNLRCLGCIQDETSFRQLDILAWSSGGRSWLRMGIWGMPLFRWKLEDKPRR